MEQFTRWFKQAAAPGSPLPEPNAMVVSTADAEGRPSSRTVLLKSYDEAGFVFYTNYGSRKARDLTANPHVGLLFIDFEGRKRMRLNGIASADEADPLLPEYPEAQLVVRVRATQVFPNCPRYIHEYRLVRRSRFVPKAECETPVPQWKQAEWSHDALPANDPALDPSRETIHKG